MEPKFENPYYYGDDEFEHLVNFSGALVPIAHIKIIGQVEPGIVIAEDEDGSNLPLCGFPVMLTDSDYASVDRDLSRMLFETWETLAEAETQRRHLAIQVDNYYKRLLGDK
ncbi:hypothetical protein [Pseudodesulfovibrio indicus]|uniref:hypothetical protein n=1 Tax=Pseudodesulfovibrio indicus TaxID=1716143 RepID=UPI00292EBA7E|nr:hypothetical protein [Pseudodesulfovibrio indicus]